MKLAQFLFKPKWQNKSPAVRRQAVVSDTSATLQGELATLMRQDNDSGVRLAALQRLNDFELYRERSTGDADGEVRRIARERYLHLFATLPAPIEARVRQLNTLETAELERIAQTAVVDALRGAALERVTRLSVLADRVVNDMAAHLRQAALERIDDPATLMRLVEKTRKTDKVVHRLARERLEAIQIKAGDSAVIAHRARKLCERLEQQLRIAGSESASELEQITSSWRALGPAIPPDIRNRYEGALRILSTPARPSPAVVEPISQTQEEIPAPHPGANIESVETVAINRTEALAAQARFDAALATAQAQSQRDREQTQALQTAVSELLRKFDSALERGDVSHARQMLGTIEELKSALGRKLSADAKKHLEQSTIRYEELARWQHWSNNQRRRQLCDDIEAMIGSGLHPDALALKIREARDEWQQLDVAEGIAPDAAQSMGLGRRFRHVCYQALKPARPYFEKRGELRKSHTQVIEALLERCAQLPVVDSPLAAMSHHELKQCIALKRELSKALRDMDRVDPRSRTLLTKRTKDALAIINPRIEAHEQTVEKAKQRLIAKAQELAGSETSEAARQVRDLQKNWQATGHGNPRIDRQQWQVFHTACDAVFGKMDAARVKRAEESAAQHAQATALLVEFESLIHALGEKDPAALARQREIDRRWQEIASGDVSLQKKYRTLVTTVEMKRQEHQSKLKRARFTNANDAYHLVRQYEDRHLSQEDAFSRWSTLAPLAPEFASVLRSRFEQVHAPRDPHTNTIDGEETARQILVQLEYLAGIESPPSEQQRRMDYQVSRLSARLRGDASTNGIEQELALLMSTWFGLPPLPMESSAALEARYDRAYSVALAQLP